jgi:hypothetical protein
MDAGLRVRMTSICEFYRYRPFIGFPPDRIY